MADIHSSSALGTESAEHSATGSSGQPTACAGHSSAILVKPNPSSAAIPTPAVPHATFDAQSCALCGSPLVNPFPMACGHRVCGYHLNLSLHPAETPTAAGLFLSNLATSVGNSSPETPGKKSFPASMHPQHSLTNPRLALDLSTLPPSSPDAPIEAPPTNHTTGELA